LKPSDETSLANEGDSRSPAVQGYVSRGSELPGWARFVLPSAADLIFVLLLVSLSMAPLAQRLLGDAGIGWPICTGELVLHSHTIPRVDPFSSTMHGQPWYAWEWLYDVAVGLIHHFAGLNGVVFFTAFLIALTFVLVFRMAVARGAGLPIAFIMLLLAVFASSIHFLARPHVLSWLFTLIAFWLLETLEARGDQRVLFWMPILILVWVNLHGGFLVAFVMQGAYLVGAWASKSGDIQDQGEAWRRIRALLQTGLLMLVASFANPYGYKLHVHIYRYLSDRFLMDHIDEFLSPNFHGLPQRCFAVLLLLGIVGMAVNRRRVGVSQLLVLCFAMYTGLYASRNIPVASMLIVLIVAPMLSKAVEDRVREGESDPGKGRLARWHDFGTRMGQTGVRVRGHAWPVVVVVLGLWICFHQGRFGSRSLMSAHFDEKKFPVRAVDLLLRDDMRAPVFCPDSWGGYLIYRLYPQSQVVVDDRHDLYGPEFLKKYLKIVQVQVDSGQALQEMQVRWVLFPRNSALGNFLKTLPGWRGVYEDDTAILLHRTSDESRTGITGLLLGSPN